MKLSVSLPDDDVAFLDECVRDRGFASRSATLQKAVQMMRSVGLVDAYAEAFSDWAESEDASLWDSTAGDGIGAG